MAGSTTTGPRKGRARHAAASVVARADVRPAPEPPADASTVAQALADAVDPSALASLLRLNGEGAAPRAHLDAALLAPAREILARPGKHLRARLVDVGWRAAGGRGAAPVELGLAVEVLHAGSLVVDDVADGSCWRRGGPALHTLVGAPLAVNTGGFLYFWPFALLRRLALPPAHEIACTRRLADTLLRCHAGQALDLGVIVDVLQPAELRDVVAASTELKTGALVELALALPAAARGALGAAEALGTCGRELGVALQMLDDLGNLSGARAPEKLGEDLRHGRPTWPWAWLAAEPERFEALRPRARATRMGAERAEDLARDLLAEVEERGRAEASARMEKAIRLLETRRGRPAEALRAVVRRIESAYV